MVSGLPVDRPAHQGKKEGQTKLRRAGRWRNHHCKNNSFPSPWPRRSPLTPSIIWKKKRRYNKEVDTLQHLPAPLLRLGLQGVEDGRPHKQVREGAHNQWQRPHILLLHGASPLRPPLRLLREPQLCYRRCSGRSDDITSRRSLLTGTTGGWLTICSACLSIWGQRLNNFQYKELKLRTTA